MLMDLYWFTMWEIRIVSMKCLESDPTSIEEIASYHTFRLVAFLWNKEPTDIAHRVQFMRSTLPVESLPKTKRSPSPRKRKR